MLVDALFSKSYDSMSIPAIILAGGLGTRISEETVTKPKPMVSIGEYPILWHIMKGLYAQGVSEFVIALGYRGNVIKQFFLDYRLQDSHLVLDDAETHISTRKKENWRIHLIETGVESMTGGRIKQAFEYLQCPRAIVTYGDGVADVNVAELRKFHEQNGRIATLTAVRPPARFGSLSFCGNAIDSFREKSQVDEGWINGGYFVLEQKVTDYIKDNVTPFEREPLELLAKSSNLVGFKHYGFWQCMDTLRDAELLRQLWATGKAPWKNWD